jgi:hypothetical protein
MAIEQHPARASHPPNRRYPMKSIHSSLATAALAALAATSAAAQAVEGVLEQGPVWSALFTVSAESGDLVGQTFRNQSAAGRAILAGCLPGLWCKVARATTREMRDTTQLAFAERPSAWREITAARDVGMQAAIAGHQQAMDTRRGPVAIGDDGTLRWRGRPVLPAVQANNSLSLVARHEVGRADVLLLQNHGGSACPALYRFITVSPSGITASPEFGTCSDLIYPTSNERGVTVAMPAFAGPGQRAAPRRRVVYRFENGRVTENGRALR